MSDPIKITISTPPANRKELAEAFGQNQSAVRRLEKMTLDVRVNLPDAIEELAQTEQQNFVFLAMLVDGSVPLPGTVPEDPFARMLASDAQRLPMIRPALSEAVVAPVSLPRPMQSDGVAAVPSLPSPVRPDLAPLPLAGIGAGMLALMKGESALGSAPGVYQGGRLLNARTIPTGTVYTRTPSTTFVWVRFQAPGGAGGGTPATGAGQSASAGGGGAGAYVEALFLASVLDGQTVSLGTAGTGNSAAAGTAGTTATFGTAISAPGGTGGNVASALSAPGFTGGSAATAAPTVTGALQVLIAQAGIGGDPGIVFTAGALSMSGRGGSSPLTNSSLPTLGNGSHGAFGIGAGGNGANAGASQSAFAGGTAAAGFCEVWEFS
ncbi:hypothetical protein [Burkholderia cepacia]|uniref:hypothetical protein n=1 Tax=Burkholderia cepacia TaxID=292 RepID=UPI00398E94C1